MPRVMTTPTKQELRDTIKAQQETIDHLQNQLDDNESLRDKLAKKASTLAKQLDLASEERDNQNASLMAYRECKFNASDVFQLTEQLSLSDVEMILCSFHSRFECFAIAGEGGYWLPFSDDPFTLVDGCLQIVFDTNKNRQGESQ